MVKRRWRVDDTLNGKSGKAPTNSGWESGRDGDKVLGRTWVETETRGSFLWLTFPIPWCLAATRSEELCTPLPSVLRCLVSNQTLLRVPSFPPLPAQPKRPQVCPLLHALPPHHLHAPGRWALHTQLKQPPKRSTVNSLFSSPINLFLTVGPLHGLQCSSFQHSWNFIPSLASWSKPSPEVVSDFLMLLFLS